MEGILDRKANILTQLSHLKMETKTKYDIGDMVWLISSNKAAKRQVTRVIISAEEPDRWEVKYSLQYGDTEYPENQLFKTEEELLKSL